MVSSGVVVLAGVFFLLVGVLCLIFRQRVLTVVSTLQRNALGRPGRFVAGRARVRGIVVPGIVAICLGAFFVVTGVLGSFTFAN